MTKKTHKLKHLKEFAKSFNNEQNLIKDNLKKNLLKSKDGIENVTTGACIRPDIYLDNDRYCENCPYIENCACGLKRTTISKKRK